MVALPLTLLGPCLIMLVMESVAMEREREEAGRHVKAAVGSVVLMLLLLLQCFLSSVPFC